MDDIKKVNTGLKCLADVHDGNCVGCGYSEISVYPVCVRQVSKDALSVIEKLQAEIERIKKDNELIVSCNSELEEQRTDFAMMIEKQRLQIERLQPKKGKWLEYAGDQKCSVCGSSYSDLYPEYSSTPFCPHCGAEMEEGDEE